MKARRTGSYIAIALAAILTIALLVFRSLGVEVAYPFEHATRCLAKQVWPRVAGVFKGSSACAENVRLRREVASLALLRGEVERLEVENARLRRSLDYMAREPEGWLAAGVLSSGGGAAGMGNSIRVDKGSLAGVKAGGIVVVPEGLVGRVARVTPHTAEVTLVTDPRLKVACVVKAGDGRSASGILSGGSSDRLLLRYLRDADGIGPHARVLTSGRGGVFPAGYDVGTLLTVTNGVCSLEGEVLPRVDYSTLEDVFIRHAR